MIKSYRNMHPINMGNNYYVWYYFYKNKDTPRPVAYVIVNDDLYEKFGDNIENVSNDMVDTFSFLNMS